MEDNVLICSNISIIVDQHNSLISAHSKVQMVNGLNTRIEI